MEFCLQKRVDKRLEDSLKKADEEKSKDSKKPEVTITQTTGKQTTIKVKVTNSMSQKYVVWLGGSSFSSIEILKQLYIPEGKIKKWDHPAVDLTLFLVSKNKIILSIIKLIVAYNKIKINKLVSIND